MKENAQTPAKKPNTAWRIIRVILQVIGQILLWVMVVGATLALIVAVAGSIFRPPFADRLVLYKHDIPFDYRKLVRQFLFLHSYICFVFYNTYLSPQIIYFIY